MTKKLIACFVILSFIFSSINLESKGAKSPDRNISSVIKEIEKIREGGITWDEVQHLIEFLQEKFGEGGVYVNMMCKVTGIGMGLLFPPFIPVTPVLFAALGILLSTDGLMGQWSHMVHLAIFIPFVGFPAYFAPPALFIIAGFAGVVIGVAIFS
ncbi:MAG: hypothetical protein J7L58_05990 [Thermoplasmata archaeon]|nr:hypothetical protein [Thermoplasmata archaeon]